MLDELDSLDDESNELGSDSGSYGTYSFRAFYFRFDKSVVGVLGSNCFAPIGVNYKGSILLCDVLVPIGVDPKGGQLLALFWRSKILDFISKFQNNLYRYSLILISHHLEPM